MHTSVVLFSSIHSWAIVARTLGILAVAVTVVPFGAVATWESEAVATCGSLVPPLLVAPEPVGELLPSPPDDGNTLKFTTCSVIAFHFFTGCST